MTTASGAFASARFHAPFGAPWYTPTTAATAPALGTRFGEPWPAAGTPQAVAAATDRHYTGQRSFEASLGSLYHYQARWYSPVLGRFLSPDPIVPEPGNPQALNRYSYVYNNPFIYTDPSGLVIVRNSAGEVWKGAWYYPWEGKRTFRGQYQLYAPSELRRVGSSGWLGCRDGRCTTYRQHYDDGYWVLRKRSPLKVLGEAVVAAITGGAGLAPNCEEPGSSFCFGNQPSPLPNGALGMMSQPGFAWPGGSPGNRVKPRRPTMVYRSVGADGRVNYVGITYKDRFVVRQAEQWREKGIRIQPIPGLDGLTRQEAHAVEEALIVRYKLGKEGGPAQQDPQYLPQPGRLRATLATRAGYLARRWVC